MSCRRYGERGLAAQGRDARYPGAAAPPSTYTPDPIAITAWLGVSDAFDRSVTDSLQRYADQDEPDYQDFVKAIRSRRLENARACPTTGGPSEDGDRCRPGGDGIGASRPGPDAGGRKNQ